MLCAVGFLGREMRVWDRDYGIDIPSNTGAIIERLVLYLISFIVCILFVIILYACGAC